MQCSATQPLFINVTHTTHQVQPLMAGAAKTTQEEEAPPRNPQDLNQPQH